MDHRVQSNVGQGAASHGLEGNGTTRSNQCCPEGNRFAFTDPLPMTGPIVLAYGRNRERSPVPGVTYFDLTRVNAETGETNTLFTFQIADRRSVDASSNVLSTTGPLTDPRTLILVRIDVQSLPDQIVAIPANGNGRPISVFSGTGGAIAISSNSKRIAHIVDQVFRIQDISQIVLNKQTVVKLPPTSFRRDGFTIPAEDATHFWMVTMLS